MQNNTEYIAEINDLLKLADERLLDLIFQILQKSVNSSLIETHSQSA